MSIREELAGIISANACKLCAYLATLPDAEATEWHEALALPVGVVNNRSVLLLLARRGVQLTKSSVVRHRSNHEHS